MITHLRIRNFKGWKDSGPIRFAPITVLFGGNSAGKTSIPQLLLLMKQTAESSDRKRVLHLGDGRTLVDLGTYADCVHQHDLDQPVRIELGWELDTPLQVTDSVSKAKFKAEKMRFEVEFQADQQQQPYVEKLEFVLGSRAGAHIATGMKRQEGTGKRKKYDLFVTGDYSEIRQKGRAWPLPGPYHFYGFPDEAVAYYQNTAYLSDFTLQLQKQLRSLFYVGPLREYPKRLYLWSGEIPPHVGVRGDRAVEAILAARSRKFNWKAKQHRKPLDQLVAARLQEMGLIFDFEVKPLAKHRKEYEVLVRTTKQLPQVRLTDVGFGVSQVLPVIVECFYVPARSVVIFEQPEIHLHPKVQADLADLFIDAIHSREDGRARNVQFIIESHSEYFLRRLQRRIAEDALKPEEAALYFVKTEGSKSVIDELDVDLFGNIGNWPSGFFGDEMGELVARTKAQARRMAAGSQAKR